MNTYDIQCALTFLQEKCGRLFSVLHPSAIPHAASASEGCCWEHLGRRPGPALTVFCHPPCMQPWQRVDSSVATASAGQGSSVAGYGGLWYCLTCRCLRGLPAQAPADLGWSCPLFFHFPGPWEPISSGVPLNLSLPPGALC